MIKEITMQEALTALQEGKKVYRLDLEELSLTELSRMFTGKLLVESPDQENPQKIPKEDAEKIPKEKPRKKSSKKRNPVDTGKIGALRKAGWPVAKIADEMGLSQPTIYSYLKKLGLK